MGNCSPTNTKDTCQKIKLTPRHWEGLSVLTQSHKMQVLKKLFSTLDDAGKITCCSEIFFEEKSELSKIVLSLLQSIVANRKNIEEVTKFMDDAFLTLAISNGLSLNPKYLVSTSIRAMKRLASENKPNLVYKFSQMLTLQKVTNTLVLQLDECHLGYLWWPIVLIVNLL